MVGPKNLVTVCKESHWKDIHSENNDDYHQELGEIARQNTERATRRGWKFPE